MIKNVIRSVTPKLIWEKLQKYKKLQMIIKIPSYEEKRFIIQTYAELYHINTLVETGTFLGDTVQYFKDKFNKIYSIELSEELAAKAKERFKNDSNILIIQGDSGRKLMEVIKEVDSSCMFWLDGHYSSEFYIDGEFFQTGRSEKDTPIIKELEIVLKDKHRHIILIDDARLYNGIGDYPSVGFIKNMIKSSRNSYILSVEKDIIRIVPDKSNNSF
jgi:hypothetical protein